MPNKKKDGFPEDDPYEILDVPLEATEAQITKAYRKLALRLHPDKQRGSSEKELEHVAAKFHKVQQARSFLLDSEHASAREKYRRQRTSQQMRRKADAAHFAKMSGSRKRMREELKRQEEEAIRNDSSSLRKTSNKRSSSTSDKTASARARKREEDAEIESLRRQGKQMREAHAERNVRNAEAGYAKQKEKLKDALEERQVRLKWSRKKMKESPSEDSLAKLLSRFGPVDAVEMLGSKGNSALVTFTQASSCSPCVEAYLSSNEMRASYVGKRKEREQQAEDDMVSSQQSNNGRDRESLQDWKIRRDAEREQLLRQQLEKDEAEASGGRDSKIGNAVGNHGPSKGQSSSVLFPPPFPKGTKKKGALPLPILEQMEASIFKDILPAETLEGMQVK